jgi:hypothetical protein
VSEFRFSGGFAIYAICNHATGTAYIGQAASPADRWTVHRNRLRAGKHHNRALQLDYTRDGEAAFGLIILEKHRWLNHPSGNGGFNRCAIERSWCQRARAVGIVLYNDQVQRGRRKAA